MVSYLSRSMFNPILPWDNIQEESSRFTKILLISLGLAILFIIILELVDIEKPIRKRAVIPERLVKIVLEKKKEVKPPPPPVEVKKEEKPEEKPEEKKPEEKKEEPKPEPEKKTAKEKVREKFSAQFDALADLRDTDLMDDLSNNTSLSNDTGQAASVGRNLINKGKAAQGSGGYKVAAASTSAGTGALKGQNTTKVTSEIGQAVENTKRVTKSGNLKRSAENIQLTFEKYKPQIFSQYKRALRKDPSLQGRVNFRLVILPNGSVSKCTIELSELNNPELEKRLISRIKRINFGAMNVEIWNDTYLINFFPS